MSVEKSILGVIPGLQATALLGNNLRMLKMLDIPNKRGRTIKKPNLKRFNKVIVRGAVTNFVGIPLIKATSEMVGDIQ